MQDVEAIYNYKLKMVVVVNYVIDIHSLLFKKKYIKHKTLRPWYQKIAFNFKFWHHTSFLSFGHIGL